MIENWLKRITEENMYYVISVTGYETYEPHWFSCDCSKKEFDRVVKESIEEAVDKIIRKKSEYPSYIDGHDLMPVLDQVLAKKGFKKIKIDHEISIGGECIYRENERNNPETKIFSDSAWEKIIEHNKKIDGITYDDHKERKTTSNT